MEVANDVGSLGHHNEVANGHVVWILVVTNKPTRVRLGAPCAGRPARAAQPPRTQTEGGPAVVDQPGKPAFGETVAPRRIDRKLVTMAEEPTPSTARRNTMDAFPERPKAGPRRRDPGDQEPLEGATRGGGAGRGGGTRIPAVAAARRRG
jgi:hypothetical protein